MDIGKLIGEATEYDKKLILEARKPKSWCKSVSAFANTFGGALIFGITNDGQIVGLEDPSGDAEKISEIIKTRLDPIPEFRLRFEEENENILVVLDIFKGDETPYYYSGDGVLEAYVRVGNESVKATATELKRLVLRGRNTSYDSQISAYKVDDYAFSKLRERYKKWTGNSFDEKDLISFGMADGSVIQERDPLTVPSTRRNPVLADVLNRLGYMERKGSGFGKIISGYEVQVNYAKDKKPSFRSDRYQFTVIMPNLNYDVPQDVPQDVLDKQIMSLIRKNNKISTEKMAIALGVSAKTVKRHIKAMDNVHFVGRGFSGYWEIIEE